MIFIHTFYYTAAAISRGDGRRHRHPAVGAIIETEHPIQDAVILKISYPKLSCPKKTRGKI